MKRTFYLLLLLLACGNTAVAQSGKLEIGLTGGIHFHTHPEVFAGGVETVINPGGALAIRYLSSEKWQIGAELFAAKWSGKHTITYTDYNAQILGYSTETGHEASPMLGGRITATRLLGSGKGGWQSAITGKAGYASATKSDENFSLPGGSGFTAGLQFEETRMVTSSFGLRGNIGAEYYQIKWKAGWQGITDHLLSIPVQVGFFMRL